MFFITQFCCGETGKVSGASFMLSSAQEKTFIKISGIWIITNNLFHSAVLRKFSKIFKNYSLRTLCRQKQDQHSPHAKSNPVFLPEIRIDHRLSRTFHLMKIYVLTELWMISIWCVIPCCQKLPFLKVLNVSFLFCFLPGSSLTLTVKEFLHFNL